MKTLIIKTKNTHLLDNLTYEQRGKIFTLLAYAATDNLTADKVEELKMLYEEITSEISTLKAFLPFETDFKEDKAKYDATVARNRVNGRKGGRPRKSVVYKPEKPVWLETQKTTIEGLTTLNHNHNNIIKKEKERKTPTLEEVLAAANRLMVLPDVATKFFYYYDAIGWMINDRPIVNWQSKLMEWKNNSKTYNADANTNSNTVDFHTARKQQIYNDVADAIVSSENGDAELADYSIL